MAVNTGLSQQQVQTLIQQRLLAHRSALEGIVALHGWTAGLSPADLASASGWSTGDAGAVLSAVADANAEAQIHYTGLPPGTYPQPSSAYPYANSQQQVTGPL